MKVRVVAAAVVLVAGVSGCSGKSDPIETPETVGIPGTALPTAGEGATSGPVPPESSAPTGSGSSSRTVVADPQPGVDYEVTPQVEASAVAFVRHYLAAYDAGLQEPDGARLLSLSHSACKPCAAMGKTITDLKSSESKVESPTLRIVKIKPDMAYRRAAVLVEMDQLPAVVVDRSGRAASSVPRRSGVRRSYFLTKSGDSWKMKDIKTYEGAIP